MKEQEPDYLKMAIDSMVDDEVEGPRVILGPVALKHFFTLVRNAALEEAAQKCVASELIDMPTRHEIATVRKCAKAIESLKEPTP